MLLIGEIAGNYLYLTNIFSCCYFEDSIDGDISIYKNDNSKSRKSKTNLNKDSLDQFIYTQINWTRILKLKELIKMNVKFSANEQGFVDEVEIVRGVIQNREINMEVIRVIQKIHGRLSGEGTMGFPRRTKTDVSCRGRLTRSSDEVSELRSNHEYPKEINSL